MSDGGKGDKRRPTDAAAYAEGWERVWGETRRAVPQSDGLMAAGLPMEAACGGPKDESKQGRQAED